MNVKMDVISLVGRCLISCILLSILWKEKEYIPMWALVPAMLVAALLAGMLLAGYNFQQLCEVIRPSIRLCS